MQPSLFTLPYGCLCLMALLFFCSYHLLTPVFPMYLQSQGVTGTLLGFMVAAFMGISLLLRPLAGKWADEWGARPLMWLGLALFALSPLLYGLGHHFFVGSMLLIRLLHGAGFALFYTAASVQLVNLVPPERKAEGISHYSNAIKVAMAIAPALGLWLVHQQQTQWAFYLAALLALAVVPFTFAIASGSPGQQPAQPLAQPIVHRKVPGKWFNTNACLPGVTMGLNSLAFGALIPFFPLLAAEKGMTDAAWFYTVYAVCLIASRWLAGSWSDRYGRAAVVLPSMGMVALSVAGLMVCQQPWLLLVLAGCYGLSAGMVQPSLMAMAADRVPRTEMGSAMATFTLLNDLGIALGSFVMGTAGSQWGYGVSLAPVLVGVLLGTLILWLYARQPQPRALEEVAV